MPHSACNCRCVMCDIWKDNKNLKQLTEDDVKELLDAFEEYGTKMVLMSGGEAILNPNFFRLCELLKSKKIKITLLSTGLTLKKEAENIVRWIDEVIISLDGPENIHNEIRNIPSAYIKLKESVQHIKSIKPGFRITARSVIQSRNFRHWPAIIDSAKEIGLDQISFLPADVSSSAFNRETAWDDIKKNQVQLSKEELPEFKKIVESLLQNYKPDFENKFIVESPEKIKKIYFYYAAGHRLNEFPYKKCNAPWVSTVIEADGTVRHCFFHEAIGNIHTDSLQTILNSENALGFRKNLDMSENETCVKCVCYLNLKPTQML